MPIITSQQINKYYAEYKEQEITFNNQIIQGTGLLTKQVFIKCQENRWPAVIYSSSMSRAKIITTLSAEELQLIKKADILYLRFAFRQEDKTDPILFFIPARITGLNPYKVEMPNFYFISLCYTTRPPDDLIEILSSILETNSNAKRRKDERIVLNPTTEKKLGLESKKAYTQNKR